LTHFYAPEKSIGAMDASSAARLLVAASDITLVLDEKGVIRDFAVGGETLTKDREWLGQKWIETVTVESRPKVEELLREAKDSSVARSREINHRLSSGQDLPIRYSAFQIGKSGRVLALGRDLRMISQLQQRLMEAQRTTEHEFLRLRSAETRYRILFQMSEEAVIIVDAHSLKTVDANPAAAALIETTSGKLVGRPLSDIFDPSTREAMEAQLESIRAIGRIEAVRWRLANQRECWMSASFFRHDDGAQILIRLTPVLDSSATRLPAVKTQALRVIESLPDAFLVVDQDRRVLDANTSFLEIAELSSLSQARGQSIDRWLGRSNLDVNLLFSNLRDHGSVRDFKTLIHTDYGATEEVEVSGVAVPGDNACYGLVIHSVARRGRQSQPAAEDQVRSAEQLAELVGRVPLKQLVRQTVELTERMCIEASLRLTGDNRAAAAQMLGLSRQSLYDKLHRYDLGDLPQDDSN
jgi:transcriptional regulator PpsR